jgi:hypothetical protein
MLNTVLEVAGLALITAALVCLVVVAWSFHWRAGLGTVAVEALVAGVVLVVLANRRPGRPA